MARSKCLEHQFSVEYYAEIVAAISARLLQTSDLSMTRRGSPAGMLIF
jgi:hypothetical protein